MTSITIQGRSVGAKRNLFEDFSVPIPPEWSDEEGSEEVFLRDVIERIVRHQVAAYNQRQERSEFVRVLSQREIEMGAAAGRVHPGGREEIKLTDAEAAVGTALLAFEDGLYFVVVDGEQQKDLDARIRLQESSTLTFIRLTMLAGG